ncbi:MAG: 23S rRNA (uracil(1939)-C(5))-methyltransferase RlmD [Bacteroidales bacterium]|nr:23S rRNA (uracil(1939)-C(5))-methyltransferase RlmD [Bacteroidales bacterium]MDT8431237.1 23S rRNA (uracil(1939)-C(5))-methyltransferase RlmD [Bacteroidales bacterium]
MGRRKLPAYEAITIADIAAEGKSIARIDDLVVFVPGAVPGDVVDLQVTRKRKKYLEARVTRYVSYSDERTEPFCSHFGTCGGCKWQHLPYPLQLKYKEKQVQDALQRIGKIRIDRIDSILGAEKTRFYRNKLEYTFSNHRWLSDEEAGGDQVFANRNGVGFHVPGRFDRVVDVEKCYLQEDPSNEIRDTLREFALQQGLSFYDHRTNEGLLRNVIIRTTTTGEVMVVVSVQFDEPVVYEMLENLNGKVKGITSLMYVINPKLNETLYDQDIKVFSGRDHLIEELDGLKFKIGPKSFFQTNTSQALELYRKTKEFAGLRGDEIVYDLYTGAGTIANYIAGGAGKVVGIESVPEAIADAVVNSNLNGIANTSFHAGDMKDLFNADFMAEHGRPEVVITDPPRAGMHQQVVEALLEVAPEKIVYVSCNPATQARDVRLLSEKYTFPRNQAVDMFPHTHHIENVLLLHRK